MTESKNNPPTGFDHPQIQQLRAEIINQMDDRIADSLQKLPREYFQQIPREDHLQHFKALVAIKVCDIRQEITIRHRNGRRITIVSHQNHPGLLARLIRGLPKELPLVGAKIFTSTDDDFIVDVFDFQHADSNNEVRSDRTSERRKSIIQKVADQTGAENCDVETFVDRYHHEHEILGSPEELSHQFLAFRETAHINDIVVLCGKAKDGLLKVTVSAASSTTRTMFERAADFFGQRKINIVKAICENVMFRETIPVALLTFDVQIDEPVNPESLARDMEHYLRVDPEAIKLLGDSSDIDLQTAELFCCLAKLTQHAINFCEAFDVSAERVLRTMRKHDSMTLQSIRYFVSRFRKDDPEEAPPEHALLKSIADPKERTTMRTLFGLVHRIERANLCVERKRCIAFRLPGEVFENLDHGNTPFAIFYVYGNGFDGFHVRFRNVARGGMRLVPTRNASHYLFESNRVFEEAWRLATAQQLKNKDIAEGGSKAVVVIKPDNSAERAGRDFVDGLLDLLLNIDQTTARDLDSIGEEYLYLGPDENVTNDLINWIVDHSAERGYRFPATIMSSKPSTGINHKEFGVTSEGVLIFLRQSLIEHGIDPDKSPFTIKLTGGPDGDVGGNAIRILIRDYPNTARIVAVADGTGAASDPDGLNLEELLRLVEAGQGIASFDAGQLSAQGSVTGLGSEAEVTRRNELHNQIKADVFLPAGGRPSTINENNWHRFLDGDGVPCSPIIVEGANLFITDPARKLLSDSGVAIVKDSSANKCGVICSSMEIIAGMLLTEEQFLAIKPDYVSQVLQTLCSLAEIESISLFNERSRMPDLTLPEISVRISEQIIRVADIIDNSIGGWTADEQRLANEFIRAYLPKSLTDTAGDELFDRFPKTYRRQLIASILSSRIVYREGCQNLESMREETLARLIRNHLVYESKVRTLLATIESSDLADKQTIAAIVEHSGARSQRDLRL
ncbi:NAD-glutamate dehydrogenase domain-containing protein [Mariniblastus fucicola]|uniref:NAD-specific glutamate dehydrogenase n=1 Tax=Mariniblastus fucicola TaxID=980251 RepID=A0A5B9PB26_9BACT|nr:NAD-glutamate dehydrogenase domain-containing protein [Mariniblastus fucicola]QEG20313.1 NAD-specific glutamate dehydrogenase [Mariniblastus fucicola]